MDDIKKLMQMNEKQSQKIKYLELLIREKTKRYSVVLKNNMFLTQQLNAELRNKEIKKYKELCMKQNVMDDKADSIADMMVEIGLDKDLNISESWLPSTSEGGIVSVKDLIK